MAMVDAAEMSPEETFQPWSDNDFNLGAPMSEDADIVEGQLLSFWDTMADYSADEVAQTPSGSGDASSADEVQAIPWPATDDELHDLYTEYMAEESENS